MNSKPIKQALAGSLLATLLFFAAFAAFPQLSNANSSTAKSYNTKAALKSADWNEEMSLTYEKNKVVLTANGIPDHPRDAQYALPKAGVMVPDASTATIGNDPTKEQSYNFDITTKPKYVSKTTSAPLGSIGLMISGAVLFNPYEGDNKTIAMNAGALGCSSSRTLRHRVPDGRYVPGTFARVEELLALAEVLAKKPGGIFEVAPRFDGDGPAEPRVETELAWMEQVSQVSQSPLTFNLTHTWEQGEHWRTALDLTRAANSRGARIRPQTVARFVGVLTGLMHRTPFDAHSSWYALRDLPLTEKLAMLNNVDRKAELVNEAKNDRRGLDNFFLLNGPNNQALYECRPEQSLIAIADQSGVTPVEVFIDLAQATDGKLLLSWPLLNQSRDAIEEMIKTPEVLMGLADTGAHVGQTMDASAPTYLLSHWARDRKSITLEEAVRKITSDTAQTFGLANRGVLALGAYADVNVINYEELSLLVPEYRHDFPHNAGRFAQKANGYEVTIVNGEVFMEHGEHTGALAGTVLRSV